VRRRRREEEEEEGGGGGGAGGRRKEEGRSGYRTKNKKPTHQCGEKTQLQPPFSPSVDSLCHP